jgi:hypothetical protein
MKLQIELSDARSYVLNQWFLTFFVPRTPLRACWNLRARSQKNANPVDYYELHVFAEKGTSRNHMYSSLPFLGYNNFIVRFV